MPKGNQRFNRYRKRVVLEQDVYSKALERIEHLYKNFDDVIVSFSGGKDSTATLLCVIEVATKLGKLPVRAVFYDEEAIHPPTIEYVERVASRPDVALEWYCLPVKHRNACSNEQPFWYCWNPEEKDIWVRDLPPRAITSHPKFLFGMSMQDFGTEQWNGLNVVVVQGIRTEESLRRQRMVSYRQKDNYITRPKKGSAFAYPIYDWTSKDVWRLITVTGEDYNRTYDIFNRTDLYGQLLMQRVCPPFGEEPIRGLWIYAECFPDMWHKMIGRVKGAATAARYGNTSLYRSGALPDQTNWREHIDNILIQFSDNERKAVGAVLNEAMKTHFNKTNDPIPADEPHPITGCSWKFMAKIATRGDFKGRTIGGMQNEGIKTRDKMGISLDEAILRFGKPEG